MASIASLFQVVSSFHLFTSSVSKKQYKQNKTEKQTETEALYLPLSNKWHSNTDVPNRNGNSCLYKMAQSCLEMLSEGLTHWWRGTLSLWVIHISLMTILYYYFLYFRLCSSSVFNSLKNLNLKRSLCRRMELASSSVTNGDTNRAVCLIQQKRNRFCGVTTHWHLGGKWRARVRRASYLLLLCPYLRTNYNDKF
jgi:hypothetical protein